MISGSSCASGKEEKDSERARRERSERKERRKWGENWVGKVSIRKMQGSVGMGWPSVPEGR